MSKIFKHLHFPDYWRQYWTKYPEGYTILEALINWTSQVNDMVDNQNNLANIVSEFKKEISDFVNEFDFNLQDKVQDTLEDWQDSGFLEIVISEALQTQIDTVEHDLDDRGINVLLNGVVGDGVHDDTEALQKIINENQVVFIPIPPNSYRITDTIRIPSYRKIVFQGNGHWNVGTLRNIKFVYDGELSRNKAMFLISSEEPGIEPTVDRSHVRFEGNVLLDGNSKIGWGLYGAYVINESHIGNITATRCLVEGIEINKAWYTTFGRLVARNNFGGGIAFGKNFWGGINGCGFEYIRAWGNGQDGSFSENNYTLSRGIFISLGYGNEMKNIISERNFGPGVVYRHGVGSSNKISGVYLEGNGQQAREEGLTDYNWGLIVDGRLGGGKGSTIETVYLSSGSGTQQSVWLTGDSPSSSLTLRDVSGGSGGVFIADWENYYLDNTVFSTRINGHFPIRTNDVINTNYNTLYVRNGGSDTNTGRSEGSPYLTIEKAVSKARNISTVNTINIEGLNVVNMLIDLKGIDREITIIGDISTKIGSTSNSSGIEIINGSAPIFIENVGKINRLRYKGSTIVVSNCSFGHEDSSFSRTIEGENGEATITNSTIDGSDATNKNGIRLNNSKLSIANSPITGYGENTLTLIGGSVLMSDVFYGQYHYTNFEDGTGMVLAGNRMLFVGGYIYNGDE